MSGQRGLFLEENLLRNSRYCRTGCSARLSIYASAHCLSSWMLVRCSCSQEPCAGANLCFLRIASLWTSFCTDRPAGASCASLSQRSACSGKSVPSSRLLCLSASKTAVVASLDLCPGIHTPQPKLKTCTLLLQAVCAPPSFACSAFDCPCPAELDGFPSSKS